MRLSRPRLQILIRLLAIVSRYGALAAQFLIVVTVARTLPKAESGTYLLVFSAVTTTIVFVGFGAPDGLVKTVPSLLSSGRADAVRRQLLHNAGLTTILGLLFLALLCVSALAVGYQGSLIIDFGCWWIPYATMFFCGQAVVALGRPVLGTFLFYTLNNLVTISALIPFLLLNRHPTVYTALHVSIGAGWVAAVCGVAALLASLPPRTASGETFKIESTMRFGFVIALSRMFQGALYWVPAWVAAAALGAADAAVISAAGRLLIAATAVIAVFRFTIRPRIVAAETRGDRLAIQEMSRLVATISFAFTLVCFALVFIVGDFAIRIVFGSTYNQTTTILDILLIGAIGESIGGPVDEVLKYSGHAGLILRCLIVTVLVEFALAWVLAETLQNLEAVAAAQALAFCGMYAAQIYFCRKRLGIFIMPFPRLSEFVSALRRDWQRPSGTASVTT